MMMAIEEARKGIREGNRGYGALVVRKARVLTRAHATTTTEQDVTAHAEIKAIRFASKKLRMTSLEECTIVATSEPCPMCAATIRWAGIRRIVYGVSREETMRLAGGSRADVSGGKPGWMTEVISGVLRDGCLALLRPSPEIHDHPARGMRPAGKTALGGYTFRT